MSTETKTLAQIGEEIDQLASEAREIDPLAALALDYAWWMVEHTMRTEEGAGSCGHALQWQDLVRRDVKRKYCTCCDHYLSLYNKGRHLMGIL